MRFLIVAVPSMLYLCSTVSPGRPSFVIDREQLEYLHSLSFSWVSISRMLMIFRSTLDRRRVEYGLNQDSGTPISDQDLIHLVHYTITQHLYVGQSFVWVLFVLRGIV